MDFSQSSAQAIVIATSAGRPLGRAALVTAELASKLADLGLLVDLGCQDPLLPDLRGAWRACPELDVARLFRRLVSIRVGAEPIREPDRCGHVGEHDAEVGAAAQEAPAPQRFVVIVPL